MRHLVAPDCCVYQPMTIETTVPPLCQPAYRASFIIDNNCVVQSEEGVSVHPPPLKSISNQCLST